MIAEDLSEEKTGSDDDNWPYDKENIIKPGMNPLDSFNCENVSEYY